MQFSNLIAMIRSSFGLFGILVVIFSSVLLYVCPATSTVIEGIVISDKGPVENPKVSAYLTFSDVTSGRRAYTSSPGDKPGSYKLEIPDGRYYLTAEGKAGGREYFGYHGANPAEVNGPWLWLPFMATLRTEAVSNESNVTGISGVVTFNGKPVRDAQVSLYSPDSVSFRGMGFLTSRTGEDGGFSFVQEPGDYVVIARKRTDFRGIRPLKQGDLFCYYSGNPVRLSYNRNIFLELQCYPKSDPKAFLEGVAGLVKRPAAEMTRFREIDTSRTPQSLWLKGKVIDRSGTPLRDLYVAAYKADSSSIFQMHLVRLMPDYLTKTDDRGEYAIEIKNKGSYYIVARGLAGEAPVKGELYGLFEGNVNHLVGMERNSVEGADIVVGRVMGVLGREELESSDSGIRGKAQTLKRTYANEVIDKDTTWEGEISVEGTVLVKRGATLTLRPGTVVRFKYSDRNADGVGDGEIRVIGKFIARGTQDRPIIFTSGRERPGKNDWSYLLFFVSDEKSRLEYCIFEYAFTGLQAHFSRVAISDSVFRKNHEGIRFGRAEVVLEHNDIVGNTLGIRHTRMEGPVRIAANNIKGNEVGIFLVPSGQNTQDFGSVFTPSDVPREEPSIVQNNIFSNSVYNYRLGERQGYDVMLKENWWGEDNEQDIFRTIYDRNRDSSLGRAIVRPFLLSPVKDAGVRRH